MGGGRVAVAAKAAAEEAVVIKIRFCTLPSIAIGSDDGMYTIVLESREPISIREFRDFLRGLTRAGQNPIRDLPRDPCNNQPG